MDARFAEARAPCEGIVAGALGWPLGGRVAAGGRDAFQPVPVRTRTACPGWGGRSGTRTRRRRRRSSVREGDDGAILADGLELVLLDEPDVGDLYNFCYDEVDQVPWGPAEIHVEGDDVRAWFDDALEVQMRITRRADEPFIRIEGTIRNDRPDHRLRLHVTLPRPTATSIAGSPFELVERPLVSEGSDLETASPDVAGTRRRDGGGHGRDARGRVRVRGGGRRAPSR